MYLFLHLETINNNIYSFFLFLSLSYTPDPVRALKSSRFRPTHHPPDAFPADDPRSKVPPPHVPTLSRGLGDGGLVDTTKPDDVGSFSATGCRDVASST